MYLIFRTHVFIISITSVCGCLLKSLSVMLQNITEFHFLLFFVFFDRISEETNQQGIIQHDPIQPAPRRDPTRYLTTQNGSLFRTMSDLQISAASGKFGELFTISSTQHNVEFSADCLVTSNYRTQSCRNPSTQGQGSSNCCRT